MASLFPFHWRMRDIVCHLQVTGSPEHDMKGPANLVLFCLSSLNLLGISLFILTLLEENFPRGLQIYMIVYIPMLVKYPLVLHVLG